MWRVRRLGFKKRLFSNVKPERGTRYKLLSSTNVACVWSLRGAWLILRVRFIIAGKVWQHRISFCVVQTINVLWMLRVYNIGFKTWLVMCHEFMMTNQVIGKIWQKVIGGECCDLSLIEWHWWRCTLCRRFKNQGYCFRALLQGSFVQHNFANCWTSLGN